MINIRSSKAISLLLAIVILFGTLTSCSKQAAIMTFKDSSITPNMYSYWLSTYKSQFLSYYNSSLDSDEFWDSYASDDMTTEQYASNLTNKNIKYILVGVQLFREYGLKLDNDVITSIDGDIAEKTEYFGGRSALNSSLSAYGINDTILRDCYIAEEKLYAVYDYLYGENGIEAVSDSQIDKYYEDNYSRIRYIIIYTAEKFVYNENDEYTYDENGYPITTPLTDEEKAAKRELVDSAMLDLRAGESFEDIQARYNEVDMSYYTNGFYVSANELNVYGFELVSEVAGMKVGETRKIEDDYACYIVEKLDLIPRSDFKPCDTEQLERLEEYCIQEQYENKFSEYADEVETDEELLSSYSLRTASPNTYF